MLLPLVLTWLALFLAIVNYNAAIGADPALVGLPFLLLWEQEFKGFARLPVSKLSELAMWDFVILLAVVILTPLIELRHARIEGDTVCWAASLRRRLELELHALSAALAQERFEQQRAQPLEVLREGLGQLATINTAVQSVYEDIDKTIQRLENQAAHSHEYQRKLLQALDDMNANSEAGRREQEHQVQELEHTVAALQHTIRHDAAILGAVKQAIQQLEEAVDRQEEGEGLMRRTLGDVLIGSREITMNIRRLIQEVTTTSDQMAATVAALRETSTRIDVVGDHMGALQVGRERLLRNLESVVTQQQRIDTEHRKIMRLLAAAAGSRQLANVQATLRTLSRTDTELRKAVSSLSREMSMWREGTVR